MELIDTTKGSFNLSNQHPMLVRSRTVGPGRFLDQQHLRQLPADIQIAVNQIWNGLSRKFNCRFKLLQLGNGSVSGDFESTLAANQEVT